MLLLLRLLKSLSRTSHIIHNRKILQQNQLLWPIALIYVKYLSEDGSLEKEIRFVDFDMAYFKNKIVRCLKTTGRRLETDVT